MVTRRKPDKFPLRLHKTGQWTKKIRGQSRYFGTDKDHALAEYVRVRADLEGGRLPRPKQEGGVTVADVGNAFLTAKRQRVDAGELTIRQWQEYHATVVRVAEQFGRGRVVADLRQEDFAGLRAEAAGRLGVFALTKFIQMVRSIFKHAFDHDLIEMPIKYASSFDKPA